jgi:3-hydroxybutyryl-CoA dehydrogenase
MSKININEISVIGAGIMGHGIAQSFLMAGYPVHLYDVQEAVLEKAKKRIGQNLKLFQDFDLIKDDDIKVAQSLLETTTELSTAVSTSEFIVEAAPEDLSLKQHLFEQIESFCSKKTIIASNTSSLMLEDIGKNVKDKGRIVTTHWFNPPHIVPTVEVVRCKWTEDFIMDETCGLLEKIGKVPVRLNMELPGFLVNRIQVAMVREVLYLCEKKVASPEDIDRAIKGSIGFRLASIGPLLTMDLGGLGLWRRVCENLFPEIQSSTQVPEILLNLTDDGNEGLKSGKGFYDYTDDFSKAEVDETVRRRDREFLTRLKQLYWSE